MIRITRCTWSTGYEGSLSTDDGFSWRTLDLGSMPYTLWALYARREGYTLLLEA